MNAFWLVLLLAAASAPAAGQDFCPLVVHVMDPGGKLVSGVPVKVEEKSGRAVSSTVEKGEVRFCDLGVLHVTVSVGFPSGCNYTVVQNVPLVWSLTRKLDITYDEGVCRVDGPPPILLCAVLFRFADENGKWLPGVGFAPPVSRFPGLRSDSYGRSMVRAADGEEVHTSTDKPGYLPQVIQFKCSNNLSQAEQVITLQRAR
jgi:hypothetical protein